jgi:hypothetical protein
LGPIDPGHVPAKLDAQGGEAFAALSRGPALTETGDDTDLNAFIDECHRKALGPPKLEHTYLLRTYSANEHDVLAVFVPIQQDELGVTLAWRVLQTWPVPDRRVGPRNTTPRKVVTAQAWTESLSTQGLLLLLGRIRERTTTMLMAIPDELRAKWQGRPLARLLNTQSRERLVNLRGGGCYFSFATNSNSYDEQSDISLENKALHCAFWGLVLDLGDADLDAVNERFTPPIEDDAPRAWDLCWNFERKGPATQGTKWLPVTAEDDQKFRALKDGRQIDAIVGHSYIVRAIFPGEHDHLVAFQVVDQDEHGIFITWRILKTWPK